MPNDQVKATLHTPGPWRVMNDPSGFWVECDNEESEKTGLTFAICSFDNDDPQTLADANLIASAPDLLAERDELKAKNRELRHGFSIEVEKRINTCEALTDDRDRLRADVDRIAGQACAAETALLAEKSRNVNLAAIIEDLNAEYKRVCESNEILLDLVERVLMTEEPRMPIGQSNYAPSFLDELRSAIAKAKVPPVVDDHTPVPDGIDTFLKREEEFQSRMDHQDDGRDDRSDQEYNQDNGTGSA